MVLAGCRTHWREVAKTLCISVYFGSLFQRMFATIRQTQELFGSGQGGVYPWGLTKDTSESEEATWISKSDGNEQPEGCKDGFTYRYAHPAGRPVNVQICSTIGN